MSKFDVVKDLAGSKLGRPLLQLRNHSPKILFIAGTVGVVGTVVLACRATLKTSTVLEVVETEKATLAEAFATESMTEEDHDRKSRHIQIAAAIHIARLYALPAVVGVASIAALTGSHVILSKRNGAVMAAYAALDRGYHEYRQRVTNEYGEEVDRKFRLGAEEVSVEEKMADGTIKVSSKLALEGRFGGSPYAFIFDEQSHKFSKQPGANTMTVQMIQQYAENKFRAQGHLFLNEVMDLLGMPHTQPGSVVGWIYDPHHERTDGMKRDNYIDFGLFSGDSEDVAAFIDGNHYYVTIDPNVDGIIWDKI